MIYITDLEHADISGKTALVRVDYNVPVVDGVVVDDFRIRSSFKTINFLREKGAHIILISHIENKEHPSLLPISNHINQNFIDGLYPFSVLFCNDLPLSFYKNNTYIQGNELESHIVQINKDLERHQILLFENLRSIPGEKNNDTDFSKILAKLADFYVNEAFSVSHRAHSSVVGVPQLIPHHYAGYGMMKEVEHLKQGLSPSHPFVFILGGAKFATKLPLIEKFMDRADKVIIGGALFNDILKAKGYEVGKSLVSDIPIDLKGVIQNPKLIIPSNVIVKSETQEVSKIDIQNVSSGDLIVDLGPNIIEQLKSYFDNFAQRSDSKPFVLWNGPMGLYEQGYTEQTIGIAELIDQKNIQTLVGGGDTVAAISVLANTNPNIYISTGGGAMIEFLLKETLVGIEALK